MLPTVSGVDTDSIDTKNDGNYSQNQNEGKEPVVKTEVESSINQHIINAFMNNGNMEASCVIASPLDIENLINLPPQVVAVVQDPQIIITATDPMLSLIKKEAEITPPPQLKKSSKEIIKKTKVKKEKSTKSDSKVMSTRGLAEGEKRKMIGVTFHKKNEKWVAQASENGRSKYLGTHESAEKAARVYDAYMVSRYGKGIKTNYPKSEVDFNLVPVLKRYRRKDCTYEDAPSFVPFPHNPIYPMEQALFADHRKYRDPNRPKNPRNAYMMFVQSARKEIRDGNLVISCSGALGETSKYFGRTWKAMPEHEKQKYKDMSRNDRVRYEAECKEYLEQLKSRTAAIVPSPYYNVGGNYMQSFQNQSLMLPTMTMKDPLTADNIQQRINSRDQTDSVKKMMASFAKRRNEFHGIPTMQSNVALAPSGFGQAIARTGFPTNPENTNSNVPLGFGSTETVPTNPTGFMLPANGRYNF